MLLLKVICTLDWLGLACETRAILLYVTLFCTSELPGEIASFPLHNDIFSRGCDKLLERRPHAALPLCHRCILWLGEDAVNNS